MKHIYNAGQCVPPVSSFKRFIRTSVLTLCLLCIGLHAQEPPFKENVRFLAVDIFVDAKGKPLAAYQLEFSATNGVATIVGIEGGEHPAFREAPHYDPKAMQHEHVIIAAFSTEPANNLPIGKTRVATIQIQVQGTVKPQYQLKLVVAAGLGGNDIQAESTFAERTTP